MDALAVSTGTVSLLEDFDREPVPQPREWFATQSQNAGLVRLNALADLFTRIGDSKPGSFQPLLRTLLIGGTGVGKSTLAKEFARRRAWAYTSVDCGSWLIQSAHSKPPTLRILRDHVRSSNRTCIYLDEACKMFPSGHDTSSGWYLTVFSEFILLLDGDERLKGHEWTAEDIRKYKETCYVVCGGAFTEALKEARVAQKRGGLGFIQAGGPTVSHSSKIQEALPEEIYHRFGEHIILEIPTRQDYARGIEMIHEDLRLERAVPIKQLLDEAESSGNGTRWLTLYLTRVLLENPMALPVRKRQPPAPKSQGFDFFSPDALRYCRMITTESFALRGALGRLYAEYNRNRAAVDKGGNGALSKYVFGRTGDRLEEKLLKAICAANACGEITADDSAVLNPLMNWRDVAWEGLRFYPNELAHYEMLDLVTQTWDLVSRVCELRGRISTLVAAGRFGGSLS
jgi:hypothetical protein